MTFGSLFAGIGGIDLGLERAGMQCVWQVEIDDYARQVLAKRWPNVQRWDDVKTFPPEGEWGCDLIAGGFPCQDISNAGPRTGIDGNRSGLWSEFARIIRLLRPRCVLVENVAALLGRGIGRVVGDLAECGYDAEWDCLPAVAFGAPHIRNRVFIMAYASLNGRKPRRARNATKKSEWRELDRSDISENVHDTYRRRYRTSQETIFAGRGGIELSDWWAIEPELGRVVNGTPHRVDRLRGLGNAVVPQVAEWIGKRILEADTHEV